MKTVKALQRLAVVTGAVSTIIGVLSAIGAATGHYLIPTFPVGAVQPAPWATVSILLLGVGVLAMALQPQSRAVRAAIAGAAGLILFASFLSLATHASRGLTGPLFDLLRVTRPLGGITLLLASTSLLASARGWGKRIAGLLGVLVLAMAFVICLGFVYGGPLLMGLEWTPVPLTSATAALFVGLGLVAIGGPKSWPNRLFIGNSVQAVMFRWMVPLMALAIIVTDIATVNLFNGFSHALGSALNSVISVSVTLLVISYLSRILSERLDRVNASLRESERKYGTIFRESPVALSVTEFDTGRLVEVNAPYLELVGASSRDQILGKTLIELGIHSAEVRERFIIARIAAGITKGLIAPIRRLDGEHRTVELSLSTYEVDGKRFILASTIDVTERLRAEDQARQELAERRRVQRRLDLALRVGGIGTWELDTQTRQFQADDELIDLYGISRGEGSMIPWDSWAARVHPDDFSQVTGQIAQVQHGVPEVFVDFRVVRPDESLRYVHAAAAMLPADGERPARIVGVNIDVTDQKLAELELRKHQEGLETLVATRTAELRAAKDTAESANRAKGAFLTHMSHEIRTPMNAILGYAQLLKADGSLDGDQRKKVTAIHSSGDHLLGLLNDILEMSRIEAGRLQLSVQPFDLHVLVDGVRSMFVELTSRRGLRCSVLIPPGLVRGLQSDPGKIRQVLINLLGNATKFTERGGITMRVASQPIDDSKYHVTIQVEDTGPGIPDGDLAMIFTAFGQAEAGRMHSGTGLGLTISRSMAQLLGGDLTVTSRVDQGSTFTFTFTAVGVPDVALPDVSQSRGPQRLDPAEQRRRVLVVDDVPSNRELLEESLSRAGFQVRGAVSGEQAIEMHDMWSPDLVLMDLHMPGMGGLAAIRILRDANTRAVIVVTTAGAGDGTAVEVLEAGAVAMLRKPYRESELFETIGRAMGVNFLEVDVDAPTSERPSPPPADLGPLLRELPAELIAELRQASLQARATRLVQLADKVALHSGPAAAAIRELANGFRYRTLLDAMDGANAKS